jgi:hypothetical protein
MAMVSRIASMRVPLILASRRLVFVDAAIPTGTLMAMARQIATIVVQMMLMTPILASWQFHGAAFQ